MDQVYAALLAHADGSLVASNRMAMVKLGQQIETLRRSQSNLQAVAKGENPACGWQGGVY